MFNKKPKIPTVRFDGFDEERKRFNNQTDVVISKRLFGLIGFTMVLVLILIARLGYIQYFQSENLNVKLETYGSTIYTSNALRGEIVDRNYTPLINNEKVICINYYAPKSTTSKEIENTANFLSEKINLNMDDISLRNKKDYFMMAHPEIVEELVSNDEIKELRKQQNYSKAINNLRLERISIEMINQYMTNDDIEKARFTYLMSNCTSGYTVLAEGITVEEASVIGENANLLKGIQVSTDWTRNYSNGSNFVSVLGKVTTKKQGLPSEMKNKLIAMGYQNNSRVGISGLETQYEDVLKGIDNTYSVSYDANGNPIVNTVSDGSSGDNIRVSIDWELQAYADNVIETELRATRSMNKYFNYLFFTMMDPNTGDVIVMSGKYIDENGTISDYASGNYLSGNKIGSTVKAGTLYTGFKEKVITPNTVFVDEPIYIKGTPAKKSWKTMGKINEVDAMALSSNVYMFRVAMRLGGADYVPNQSLKINTTAFRTLRKDLGELGLGVKTGLDVPNEVIGYRGNKLDPGYLLDAAIGQYDTYTNIQLCQYASTLANGGVKIKPRLMIESYRTNDDGSKVTTYKNPVTVVDDVSSESTAFERIKLGMRACVTRTDGTSHNYWSTKPYTVYAKTGTAEDYDEPEHIDYPNHLQIGYISATEGSKPVVAFSAVCVRETKGTTGDSSAPYISQLIVDKYVEKYGLN